MATIRSQAHFNVHNDVKLLRSAIESLGTDDESAGISTLIELATERSWDQRDKVVANIKDTYDEWVPESIKEKIHDKDLRSGLLALYEPAPWRDAKWLHASMVGFGTDEKVLVEIICTRTSSQLAAISAVYHALYGNELHADVAGETSGWFETLLVKLLTTQRSKEPANKERAEQLAQELYDAGEGKWGTDEGKFIDILSTESHASIKAIFEAYLSKFESNMFDVIASEFSGTIRTNLLYLCRALLSIPQVFADDLDADVRGLGTDEFGLIRHLVARADIDLEDIKQAYEEKYKKTLLDRIKEETSGNFLAFLSAVIKQTPY